MNLKNGITVFYCRKYIWPVLFIGVFFSACGYRFSGSGNLPSGVQTVFIQVLKNRTMETGYESTVTNDLIYEFTRNGRTVEKSRDNTDAFLTGVIESEKIRTISRQGQLDPLERRVQITISLKLTDRGDTVIWSRSSISDSEAYDVGSNNQITERNKRHALGILSKRLAETAYNRLTDNF
ncbi:MAG: LPS assembly lipoprotein LptE [Desulfobacterales bacterium]